MMPPRTAYSPASRTVDALTYPLSSSQPTMPSIASMLPGMAEKACPATSPRAGTRWTMALTVVSTTDVRSWPLSRASRAKAVMRCATIPGWGEARS